MSKNQKVGKPFRTLLFAILLLALSALACGGEVTPTKVGEVSSTEAQPTEDASSTETSSPTQEAEATSTEIESTATPEGPTTYQVGDIISIGDTVMVVLGWDSPAGDDFSKPEEGNKFVVVDLLLVNQGSSSASISSLLQMELKDDTGQRYNVDLMATVVAGSSSPDGEVSPGERVRGSVGYQVPQDINGLEFVFDADVFGSGKIFVELGDEPVSVEPPADLVGEQEQTTFNVGDVVEAGELTLVVNTVTFPTGDDFTKPEEGKKFVVVDVTFTNNSSEPKAISSMLQMYLKDETGQKYDVDIMAQVASDGTSPDGELVAGETLRGQIGYQVPQDVRGLVFVFDADVFGYGKVLVQLPSE